MSHNKITIGTATPNVNGELSPTLNDLSDVSGSPSANDVLQYSGSSWSPVAQSSVSELEYIFFGHGESENYDESPATSLTTNNTLYLYDSNAVNTITGATVSTTATTGTGGGDWLNSVTLPAGTYRCTLTALPSFSASGYLAFALWDGSTTRTSYGTVGASVSVYGAGGPIATGAFELTAQTTLNARIIQSSGVDTVTNQGDAISTSSTLLIEKLA